MSLFNTDVIFSGQKYASLKKQAIKSGVLFRDPEFPPTEKSLFNSGTSSAGIEWKRPKDICADPKLVVDGISSQDLIQGEVGNCWFVAACCCLAINKVVWTQVIPDIKDQEWDSNNPEKYAGIFHFRFWRFGLWTDVVVDDLLPTRNGHLIFVHSKSKNEFWSALLEKAYAKLFGCYEALDGGELSEALEDFTGGVSETHDLVEDKYSENNDKKDEFFECLKTQIADGALMAAAIPPKSKEDMEKPTSMGLVMGHAYSVTAVRRVTMKGTGLFNLFNREKLQMIRLRNPWGGSEWKGSFSDGSEEWSKISSRERQKIGLTFDEDGEFWMTFDDYCANFANMAVCHVVNLSVFSLQKKWCESVLNEEWANPHRCGGCINHKETFLNNPQFTFTMTADDEVIIVLTQKTNKHQGEKNLTIGFSLLKVEDNRLYRVHRLQPILASSAFRNSRSVFMRRSIVKGRYVVIASTFDPGMTGRFLLRMYTGCHSKASEMELDKPAKMTCPCIPSHHYPECVTRIVILKGVDIVRKDKDPKDINAYCIITCEREKVTSPVVEQNSNPEWNTSAIFFRKFPQEKPITVEVWHNGTLMDDFVGRLTFPALEVDTDRIQDQPLLDKNQDVQSNKCGRLVVSISTSYNLQTL